MGEYDDLIPTVDVEEYYKENATIIRKYSIKETTGMMTEQQAIANIHERGFDQFEITYEYNKDGQYVGEEEVTGSEELRPLYQTYYRTENGETWSITFINEFVSAAPACYNLERSIPLMLSETETTLGYDNHNNLFYEIIPKKKFCAIKLVNRIDAETLEAYAKELGGNYNDEE